jgi:predicted dinucleotide-binding enzyme
MKIAIIGAGNIGRRLAKHWALAGYETFLGVRDPSTQEIKDLLKEINGEVKAMGVRDAAKHADIITICVGFRHLDQVLDEIGHQKDKLIIETINASFEGGSDAGKIISSRTGSPRVVKAFNSIGAENLDNPVFAGIAADTFICGGTAPDIEIVSALAKRVGFENVYHIGGLEKEN